MSTAVRFVAASDASISPSARRARVVLAPKSLRDAPEVQAAAGLENSALLPFSDGSTDLLTLFGNGDKNARTQTVVAAFAAERSRHLGVVRGDSITDVVAKATLKGDVFLTVRCVLCV